MDKILHELDTDLHNLLYIDESHDHHKIVKLIELFQKLVWEMQSERLGNDAVSTTQGE